MATATLSGSGTMLTPVFVHAIASWTANATTETVICTCGTSTTTGPIPYGGPSIAWQGWDTHVLAALLYFLRNFALQEQLQGPVYNGWSVVTTASDTTLETWLLQPCQIPCRDLLTAITKVAQYTGLMFPPVPQP